MTGTHSHVVIGTRRLLRPRLRFRRPGCGLAYVSAMAPNARSVLSCAQRVPSGRARSGVAVTSVVRRRRVPMAAAARRWRRRGRRRRRGWRRHRGRRPRRGRRRQRVVEVQERLEEEEGVVATGNTPRGSAQHATHAAYAAAADRHGAHSCLTATCCLPPPAPPRSTSLYRSGLEKFCTG